MTARAVRGAPKAHPPGGPFSPGKPLAALRHSDFRVLLAGNTALQVGSWVQTIGMGWLLLHDLDASATALGLVALLRGASLVLLGPVGGFLSDRFERRRQLVLYTSVSATVAGVLAVLIATGRIELWMVFVLAMVAGAVEALAGPIRSVLVYDSVAGEDLTNAVALNALAGNAMRVIGPAIGGALIGAVGTQGAFQMQAACLVVAAVLAFRLRPSVPAGEERAGVFRSTWEGMCYVAGNRRMLIIVAAALLPSFLVYPYVTFLPVFARDILGSDQTGYGYLASAVGLGSLAGGTLVAITSGANRQGLRMAWTLMLYSASVGAFALSRDLWLSVAILAVAGIFHSIYSALNGALMQLQADTAYRGRVMALQSMTWGVTPFAALVMGAMIDRWGAPEVVFGWMVVAVLSSLPIALFSKEMRRV